LLELQNVDVFYGDAQAIRGLSMRIAPGEVVSLVGGNGAGKTTTLRTISAVLRPASGTISFEGRPIHRLDSSQVVEEGVVHVPEGRKLFPEMTVQENLELGAYSRRAKPRRRQSLAEVFELFPRLAERRRQPAGTLSGGEQQMCAIGRGLMSLPVLLMLDEPSLGLAPLVVKQILDVVVEIHERGVAVLLVEQNIQHALRISDRAYVIENGALALEGKGPDLLGNEAVVQAYLGL
jgi:branched-chain amino acid transport system ATP-binding protein